MSMGRVILPRGTAPLPPFFSAHRIASSESLAATNLGDWKQLDWRNGVATAVYKLIASHSPLFILFLEMLNAPHYLKSWFWTALHQKKQQSDFNFAGEVRRHSELDYKKRYKKHTRHQGPGLCPKHLPPKKKTRWKPRFALLVWESFSRPHLRKSLASVPGNQWVTWTEQKCHCTLQLSFSPSRRPWTASISGLAEGPTWPLRHGSSGVVKFEPFSRHKLRLRISITLHRIHPCLLPSNCFNWKSDFSLQSSQSWIRPTAKACKRTRGNSCFPSTVAVDSILTTKAQRHAAVLFQRWISQGTMNNTLGKKSGRQRLWYKSGKMRSDLLDLRPKFSHIYARNKSKWCKLKY